MKKIQIVDLVRAFSICVVLAGHMQVLFVNNGSKFYFLEYLWYKFWLNHGFGVSVFFVVSGFLITRLIAQDSPGLLKPDLRNFYARRAGRILPLLLLVCLLGISFHLLADPSSPPFKQCFGNVAVIFSLPFWLSIATFSVNWYLLLHLHQPSGLGLHWYILWSLAIEEQFYLFYPLILRRLGAQRKLSLFLTILILLGPLSILAGWLYFPRDNNFFYNSFAAFNQIAIGCLLYLVSERYKVFLSSHKKKCALICLSGLLVFFTVYFHVYVRSDYWWTIWGNTFNGVGIFLFLLGGFHLKIFENKAWSFFTLPGKLSYGMYLLHSTVLFVLWPYLGGLNEWVAFLIFGGTTVGIAWLSYRFYEIAANLWVRKVLGKTAD